MRRNDIGDVACFKHVLELAENCDVYLRRWFLYASSALLRAALAAPSD